MAADTDVEITQEDVVADEPARQLKWRIKLPSILYTVCQHVTAAQNLKVAAFDLDGTLILWKPGMRFSLEPDSWVWFNASVPAKLRVRFRTCYTLLRQQCAHRATCQKCLA